MSTLVGPLAEGRPARGFHDADTSQRHPALLSAQRTPYVRPTAASCSSRLRAEHRPEDGEANVPAADRRHQEGRTDHTVLGRRRSTRRCQASQR
jgi:hypothetical protein